MRNESDEILDDLLSRWHHWQQGEKIGRGHNRKALVIGDFKISRQYDDANGQLDSDLEAQTMRSVNFQVREMEDPYRAAIYVNARACMLGLDVYTSPRLPADPAAKALVIAKARLLLTGRLLAIGVM
jgi:hypothetical protein